MAELLAPDEVGAAADALAAGLLVAFPTETVYGLGADAADPVAVGRIFAAKGRPTGHPLIVHLADAGWLDRFAADVPAPAQALAAAFWPGPLTLVVRRTDAVAPETVGGKDTVGLRVPDHPVALALLRAFVDRGGTGVAAPSANRFGAVSPTTAAHVLDDLGADVDVVIDGGPSAVGVESTIVDVTGDRPELLRPGGIAPVEIEAVIGQPLVDGRSGPARASGMLASHYAPRAAVVLVEAEPTAADLIGAGGGVGVVGVAGPDTVLTNWSPPAGSPPVQVWVLPDDAAGFAARLYATLREADAVGVERLLVMPPATGSLRDAVLDRLHKAAAPRPS
ncbi:MAG: L-threonylcarbamoyladenylate synthase [Actinomycetota bacterium]